MKHIKSTFKIFVFLFITFVVSMSLLYAYAYLSDGIDIKTSNSFYIYDKDEKLVYLGSGNSEWVDIENVSPYFLDAIISTEDKYFYKHIGFDYIRIAKAFVTNIIKGNKSEGASTITQQYAKNLLKYVVFFLKIW